MARSPACRDVGLVADWKEVIRGEGEDEAISRAAEHGRRARGMIDEQLGDPRSGAGSA